MTRKQLEQTLKQRWHEKSKLLLQAENLMTRCVEWPEKQDEEFNSVLFDMEVWLKDYRIMLATLASDLDNVKSIDSN